jgi:hypothetical protein
MASCVLPCVLCLVSSLVLKFSSLVSCLRVYRPDEQAVWFQLLLGQFLKPAPFLHIRHVLKRFQFAKGLIGFERVWGWFKFEHSTLFEDQHKRDGRVRCVTSVLLLHMVISSQIPVVLDEDIGEKEEIYGNETIEDKQHRVVSCRVVSCRTYPCICVLSWSLSWWIVLSLSCLGLGLLMSLSPKKKTWLILIRFRSV